MQWLEPIDHDALMGRLTWEEHMLAKPLTDLSDYELGVVRDILERRIKETRGNIEAALELLNTPVPPELGNGPEEVMQMTYESVTEDETRLPKYIEDLRIVQGLLLHR